MKKYSVLAVLGLSCLAIQAQDINDALRYTQSNINGTARFQAMGGAFTALGGDLSAISINPASSAVFSNNQFGITLSNYNKKNEADYFGTAAKRHDISFDLNQAGSVFVFQNDNESSSWKKITLGIAYDVQNSFNNYSLSKGFNTNSIDQYFLAKAQGIPLDLLQTYPGESAASLYTFLGEHYGYSHQTAFLGYDNYILEAASNDPQNTAYLSNIPSGTFEHYNYLSEQGSNGKVAFNLAAQYDIFYFGLNLNGHFVDYTRRQSFFETNSNTPNQGTETIREVQYFTDLYTYGSGFSFQLGGIAKVTDALRLGFSYESPTWYQLYDETSQSLYTYRVNRTNPNGNLLLSYFDQGIVNIHPEYKLQTPSKYSFGGAYVFGGFGLISMDYSIKDYSATRLKPKGDTHFNAQNNLISDLLQTTSEFRIGAEARMKQWSFRGGYNYEQSPYNKNAALGDFQQYSLGIGYNFGSAKLDLAYSRSQKENRQAMFDSGLTDAPRIKNINNNFFMTLLFEF